MGSRTLKVIIILVALLFLNIEAAHAGLIHKFKIYIRHEFSGQQIFYVLASVIVIGFLTYVIFAPLPIGKERWYWLKYYSYTPARHDYQSKRDMVKKISGILR